MDKILLESGKHLSDFPPMPLSMGPQKGKVWETIPINFLLAQQLQYNVDKLKTTVGCNCKRFNLNAEQRNVFDKGLYNGTQMILNRIQLCVLDCTVISGDPRFSGNRVLIHWIS